MMRLSTNNHPAIKQAVAEGMPQSAIYFLANVIESSAEGGKPITNDSELQAALKEYKCYATNISSTHS